MSTGSRSVSSIGRLFFNNVHVHVRVRVRVRVIVCCTSTTTTTTTTTTFPVVCSEDIFYMRNLNEFVKKFYAKANVPHKSTCMRACSLPHQHMCVYLLRLLNCIDFVTSLLLVEPINASVCPLKNAWKGGSDQLICVIQADQEYILLTVISDAYLYLERVLSKSDMRFMANIKI
uniref:Uncharacterized protein n=1 Tax=Glossina austeni TaxID=7395 RepID=A0A1A9UT68_GLOAU